MSGIVRDISVAVDQTILSQEVELSNEMITSRHRQFLRKELKLPESEIPEIVEPAATRIQLGKAGVLIESFQGWSGLGGKSKE